MSMQVGIIGCGNIFNRAHLPALKAQGDVAITAVCDIRDEQLQEAQANTGAGFAHTDYNALLARPDVQAVHICTPTHTHSQIACAALEAGKQVLCEKPMAITPEQGEQMLETARRTGKRLFIGHNRRFDQRWLQIWETVKSGRIGELVYIYRSEHAYNGAPAGEWQWQEALSGGVLMDVGIHIADMFNWFMGSEPRRVFARIQRGGKESKNGGANDAALVQIDYGEDRHALFSVSWCHPAAWGPFYASMELVGQKGKIIYTDKEAHPLTVVNGSIDIPLYSPLLSAMVHVFSREVRHFYDCLATGERFALEAENALRALKVVAFARQSAREGKPVEVKW